MGGGDEADSILGRGRCRWKGTEKWKSIRVRGSSPSAWPERKYMDSLTMIHILNVSLDVIAICLPSPHGFIIPEVS